MLKKFTSFISRYNYLTFKNTQENIVILGRWGKNGSDIKNIYANHDHCGDNICKNPIEVTNYVRNQIKISENNNIKNK